MSDNLLYNEVHTRRDSYRWTINGGGVFRVMEIGDVEIVFENGKFVSASYPFTGVYTRNGWRILAAINEKIEIIESRFMQENKPCES